MIRLPILYTKQRMRARVALGIMRAIGRMEPDAVVRTSLYRPGFFGRPFLRLVASVMRGPSEWSPGEREMLAGFISGLNRCPFCAQAHTAVANLRLGSTLDEDDVRNWRARQPDPRLAAALELVQRFTESPEPLDVQDILQARERGLSDSMITDALHVAFVFNLINRVANALGFDWHGRENAARGAAILNRTAYKVPAFLLS